MISEETDPGITGSCVRWVCTVPRGLIMPDGGQRKAVLEYGIHAFGELSWLHFVERFQRNGF